MAGHGEVERSHHSSGGADDGKTSVIAEDFGRKEAPGCCGVFKLIFADKQLVLLYIFGVGNAVSWLVPSLYVGQTVASKFWLENASTWTSVGNMSVAATGMLGAGYFGRWSDRGHRRASMFIVLFSSFVAPLAPNLIWGTDSEFALNFGWFLVVFTGPFRSQLSGSPILWAASTDALPKVPGVREIGFALGMALPALFMLLAGQLGIALQTHYNCSLMIYIWISLGFWTMALVAWMFMSFDSQPVAQGQESVSCMRSYIEPWRFVCGESKLRTVCAIAMFLTLADIMATYISTQVVFELVDIAGPGHYPAKMEAINYFNNWCNIPLIPWYILVPFIGRRMGQSLTLCMLLPILCVGFASPSLLWFGHSPMTYVLTGFGMTAPLALYPLVQGFVAQLTPPHRIAEAMGGLAACKNFATVLAPAITAVVTKAFAESGRRSLYLTIFPGGALIMFAAWPFALCFHRHMMRRSTLLLERGGEP